MHALKRGHPAKMGVLTSVSPTVWANVLDAGAVRQLAHDCGGHGPGVIIKDNPGDVFAPG